MNLLSAGARLGRVTLGILVLASGTRALAADPAPAVKAAGATGEAPAPIVNVLTRAERAAGWKLLFDGKTSKGWRGFKQKTFPTVGWTIDGGLLHFVPPADKAQRAGDILTVAKFDSFELLMEYRLSAGGNSGLKYLVDEDLVKDAKGGVGFEFQILDDEKHPDAKLGKGGNRTAGGLYDLIAPAIDRTVRPPGEWNQIRLLVDGDSVEHWLNGKKVVAFQRGSADMKALIAGSKFKDIPGFGEVKRGHILLQDHRDEVAFRNIKLRPLKARAAKKAAAALGPSEARAGAVR
jgi:hypothetical protein